MIPIVCVDDRFGVAFNKRRCSSDIKVSADILKRSEGAKLWMDTYSAKLFEEANIPEAVMMLLQWVMCRARNATRRRKYKRSPELVASFLCEFVGSSTRV